MSDTSEGVEYPRIKFITNEMGITHFISGSGTREKPYKVLGSTTIEDALVDGYHTALYSRRNEEDKRCFLFLMSEWCQ